uniref:DNA-directed DNA polymerase n=2 Tax=Caenorhabditis tropicalis TaxID=1561998 RepID=A0A1I7TFQ6_9PELO
MRRVSIRIENLRRLSTTPRRSNFERKTIETVCPRIHKYLFPNISIPSTSSSTEYSGVLPPLVADNLIDHFRILAENQTGKYRKMLEEACEFDLEKSKKVLEVIDRNQLWRYETGWTKYPFENLEEISSIDAPEDSILFFDIELVVRDGTLPTLAIALGKDAWYGWCSDRLINETEIPMTPTADHLIPIGDIGREKVVIGHNVGFDRARCREAFQRENGSKIRFMDTMSMSIPMYGMADHQQALYETYDTDREEEMHNEWFNSWKERVSKNSLIAVHHHLYSQEAVENDESRKLKQRASFVKDPIETIREQFQSLMTYCARDNILCAEIYVRLWPEFIRRFPHPATLYGMLNMGNVYLPINTYWKMFYEQNERICEEKKTDATKRIVEAARMLSNGEEEEGDGEEEDDVEEKVKKEPEPQKNPAENDIWLWHQDWSLNSKQECSEWLIKLFKARSFVKLPLEDIDSHHIALKSQLIPGIFGFVIGPYPLFKTRSKGWGFLVPNWKPVEEFLSDSDVEYIEIKTDVTEGATKKTFPIRKFFEMVKNNEYEFGEFPISPDRKGFELDEKGMIRFYQLDHPTGEGNVGDPLTKHFAKDLKEMVLRPTRYEDNFKVVLDSIQTTQFWTSYRDRYHQEVAIWSPEINWKSGEIDMMEGSIAAAVVPAGTVSRRSVHKLWVTLTNQSTEHVIGTGIKAMVQSPKGFRLVGADVDSQEQWLAALYGDASEEKRLPVDQRVAGKTAFSNMMLAGSKSDNTDLHSVVANQLKISRNHAKTLNYARLYGSGESHAGKHLMRIGGMKQADAEATASHLFKLTKGETAKFMKLDGKMNCLVDKYIEEEVKDPDSCKILTINGDYFMPSYNSQFASETVRFEEWLLSRYSSLLEGSSTEKLILSLYENPSEQRKLFVGGYESSTFNFLETSAAAHDLRTPILGCQIADSLGKLPQGTPDSDFFDKKYKRSVMNWIVQSSAVDFLHLLLVSMQWLFIEEYLKSHRNQIYYVRVRSVFYRSKYGSATAVVEIHKAHGYGNSYCAEVDMSSNKSSVTGYILYGRKVVDCDY